MLPALEGLLGQMELALCQLPLPPVPEVLSIPVAAFNSIAANLVQTLEVKNFAAFSYPNYFDIPIVISLSMQS